MARAHVATLHHFRAFVATLCLWVCAYSAGVRAEEEPVFHCDGRDPAFFQELREAGFVGYGETWDFHTCDEGSDVYAPGATARWRAWRSPQVKRARARDLSFYAVFFPFIACGALGAIFGGAYAIAALRRRRSPARLAFSCTECAFTLDVPADDPALRSLFCPACGGACRVGAPGAVPS